MTPAVSDLVEQIEQQDGARRLSLSDVINTVRLRGRSVTAADTQLEIAIAVHDVDDAGSFPPNSLPRAVVMTIYPFPAGLTGAEAIRDGASTAIADAEGEAWLRVVLGDELADYAYQLHTNIRPRGKRAALHTHQKIFASFIARRDHHLLAPDNFTWQRLSHTSQQLPRKLEPSTHNTELIELVAASGPFADAELVRDLRTNPDGTWRIQLTGDDLDHLTPVAREALEQAYQLFRIRGAIHTSLQPERLIATPHEVQLHFRWKRNPNTFAIATQLPQTEASFYSPVSNPAAWMSYRASDWDEELSTGWVRWAQRSRINGVIHLGRRQELTRSGGYSSIGNLTPRADTNGIVSIPHGENLAMDTTVTYRASRLIAWNHELDVRHKPYAFAAHAVIAWTDTPGVASLDILEALPTTPDYSIRRAAFHAIHDAADAGAHLITTTLTTPVLDELGLVTETTGRRVLDVLTMP
ncbi:hypothetical protein [Williamsia maris]|uniref:Uncharacterized protein n=1 Tax=Williamsia maris TaxID=72806 RepID=A0ABT1HJM6_9NOCA|nr:hypothetical protein [Williamsia maris]MCP2178134.1 hypothetical protein [Williamsia maris]